MDYKIIELMENLPEPLSTQHINLVCDSGAFNGSYLLGCMQYLKELEKKRFIKINKLSGSSIGSLLSFLYIIDKLDDYKTSYKDIRNGFKNDFCLKSFKKILNLFFSNLDKDTYKKLNNKLYINYYNINTNKEVIVSSYNNNNDIKEAILSSSFIPYIMNGELCYNGNIDGINPYIFKERTVDDNKILFIRLTSYGKLKKMLNIKGEHNYSERMLEGILDTHRFFKGDPSKLCSWVNNWGITDYVAFRLRQIFWLTVVLCCYILNKIKPYIPNFIINNKIVNTLSDFIHKIYQDIFIIFYNS
uniref:PNPLA domain-containing protein n=1 Tax=viral metagenome TaxID=1070528 RepID=A0A6C0B4C5_9ZZZZ